MSRRRLQLVIVANKDHGGFDVNDIGSVYPESSVLAGQTMIKFIDSFDTIELAQAAYPEATVSHKLLLPQNTVDHLPDDTDY
jgi:hypothetical protein